MAYPFQMMLRSLAARIQAANPGLSAEAARALAAEVGDCREWDSDRRHVLLRDENGVVVKRVRLVAA
jgi:hypothetical protein